MLHVCNSYTITLNFTAGTVRATTLCGVLSEFVTPSFTTSNDAPTFTVNNNLPHKIGVWRVEYHGDAPSYARLLWPGDSIAMGGIPSALWLATNHTNDNILTINVDKCYYIVVGNGPHTISVG